MVRFLSRALAAPIAACLLASVLPAEESGTKHSAADLVQAALKSELTGSGESRTALLEQALKLDPEYAPARWQAGYVRYDGKWLTPEQAAERANLDTTLREYRTRRDALVNTAEQHAELALWCQKRKLDSEARLHWTKVLEFEPSNEDALAGLGLQWFDGRLVTREQIVQARVQLSERQNASRTWLNKIVKWRDLLDRGTSQQRETAQHELRAIDDPAAIESLEKALASNTVSKKNDQCNLLLVEIVGQMQHPDATSVLLRRALFAESPEVRVAAVMELKKRPMHAYVPQLIAAIPGDIKTRFHIATLPNGAVIHEHEVLLEGRAADVSWSFSSTFLPMDVPSMMRETARETNRQLTVAASAEANLAATKMQLDWLRERIQWVLKETTGYSDVSDPALAEKQYNEYQGWKSTYVPKPHYPVQESYVRTELTPSTIDNVLTTRPAQWVDVLPDGTRWSCFPAGTPVMTLGGTVPIEKIKVGDRVLTQNPETGELTFKAVQSTSIRNSLSLMKVTSGKTSLVATGGHPFWLVGQGWRTTKNLAAGDRVHSLDGVRTVDRLEEMPTTQVYNLVVSEFHNYFVGDGRMLVHDDTRLLEGTTLLPGLPAN